MKGLMDDRASNSMNAGPLTGTDPSESVSSRGGGSYQQARGRQIER